MTQLVAMFADPELWLSVSVTMFMVGVVSIGATYWVNRKSGGKAG